MPGTQRNAEEDPQNIPQARLRRVAGRYELIKKLGQGGVATVYEAHDTVHGTTVALKQLLPRDSRKDMLGLFELEYHTLSQLKHPSIVEAYAYGEDPAGPYYTMERLHGDTLSSLCPLPWERTCQVLSQVCSALALVHSRRFVHRDVKPANILCATIDRAKLIDFGSMTAAGPCVSVVGTPPFVAPEAFGMQQLDARTDLFALGATAYYTISGRHAYPARTMSQLRHLWTARPTPLAELVLEVPPQLDELVMSLLNLEPAFRPYTAVEVMQRLSAIADLPPDPDVAAAHYLTTPSLVGRDPEVAHARKLLRPEGKGRGLTILISSAPGVGRSRCLDACVLEAKLGGTHVLRAGLIADSVPWACASSLLLQLREVLAEDWPQACPDADELVDLFPELKEAPGPACAGKRARPDVPRPRSRTLHAIFGAIVGLASSYKLAIAVDDMEIIDEPSAAMLAMLARTRRLPILLTSTLADASRFDAARNTLLRCATQLQLRPLGSADTRQLLASVLGEVPHLTLLADRLHRAAGGVPKAVMRLAQYLLDTGVVSLRDGAFVLPEHLSLNDLPYGEAPANLLLAAQLSGAARTLAERIALCPAGSLTVQFTEQLSAPSPRKAHLHALEELQSAGIVTIDGPVCALADRGLRSALLQKLDPQAVRHHRLRLADVFAAISGEFAITVSYLVQAGEHEQALPLLLENLDDVGQAAVGEQLAQRLAALPPDWLETCEALLRYCEASGQPRRTAHRIRAYLFSTALLLGRHVPEHAVALLTQLAHDSGLDLYHALPEYVPPADRLRQMLALAQERFEQADEQTRVLPPKEAIPLLGRTTSQALAMNSPSADASFYARLPDLSPLTPLSPALDFMRQNMHFVRRNAQGYEDEAICAYTAMVEQLRDSDRYGFDPHAQRYIRFSLMFVLACAEALREHARCLAMADELAEDPLFAGHAWTIRLCYALVTCDRGRTHLCRRKLELHSLEEHPWSMFAISALWSRTLCYARCEDVLRLQESLVACEPVVKQFPAWLPRLHLIRAVYQRICGDYRSARATIERAAALVELGAHNTWAAVQVEHSRILRLGGQAGEARDLANGVLAQAEAAGLAWMQLPLRVELGLAELELGHAVRAGKLVDVAISGLVADGANGVLLGEAHEARARVAIALRDADGFRYHADRCATHYRPSQGARLAARLGRLQEAWLRNEMPTRTLRSTPCPAEVPQTFELSTFFTCTGPEERARLALDVLMAHSGATSGFLYLVRAGRMALAARFPFNAEQDGLDDLVRRLFEAALKPQDEPTVTYVEDADSAVWHDVLTGADGRCYTARLLTHVAQGEIWMTGAVVVPVEEAQKARVGIDSATYEIMENLSSALHEAGDVTAIALTQDRE